MNKEVKTALIISQPLSSNDSALVRTISLEMFPLGQLPLIHYVLREIQSSGIKKVILVSANSESVTSYLNNLKKNNKDNVFWKEVSNLTVSFQEDLLSALSPIKSNPFLLFFLRKFIISKKNISQQLMNVYRAAGRPIVGLHSAALSKSSTGWGVHKEDIAHGLYKIKEVFPLSKNNSSDMRISGRFLLEHFLIDFISTHKDNLNSDLETQLLQSVGAAINSGKTFYGTEVKGDVFDCGTSSGLLSASVNSILHDSSLGNVREYLRNKI